MRRLTTVCPLCRYMLSAATRSAHRSITPEQLLAVDTFVNDAILRGIPVVTEVLPIEEAKKKGAVAMFGEKYGDVVRVVEMGDVSMEFCGGTHLDNTAKVGLFRIKSEGSVASGVRRIEATTGKVSLEETRHGRTTLLKAAQFFKTAPGSILERMEQQANEMKELRQTLETVEYKCWFYETAKARGTTEGISDLPDAVLPENLRPVREHLREVAE